MSNKSIFFPLVIFMCFVILLPVSYANELFVFGPTDLEIGSFHLHLSRHSVSAPTPSDGILTITKTKPEKTIRTGFLIFNGSFIPLNSFLSQNDIDFSKGLTLAAANHLTIFLGGAPGASVNVQLETAGRPC